jgi:cytochrome bd-type quinol oxidase subunit 2
MNFISNKFNAKRIIILSAVVFIVVGYLLMSGPGSTEQAFNPNIFSFRRIVIAPVLCLIGYLLIIVGILKKDY